MIYSHISEYIAHAISAVCHSCDLYQLFAYLSSLVIITFMTNGWHVVAMQRVFQGAGRSGFLGSGVFQLLLVRNNRLTVPLAVALKPSIANRVARRETGSL